MKVIPRMKISFNLDDYSEDVIRFFKILASSRFEKSVRNDVSGHECTCQDNFTTPDAGPRKNCLKIQTTIFEALYSKIDDCIEIFKNLASSASKNKLTSNQDKNTCTIKSARDNLEDNVIV